MEIKDLNETKKENLTKWKKENVKLTIHAFKGVFVFVLFMAMGLFLNQLPNFSQIIDPSIAKIASVLSLVMIILSFLALAHYLYSYYVQNNEAIKIHESEKQLKNNNE